MTNHSAARREHEMPRRSFVLLATGGVLMSVFPGCARDIGISERERQALVRVARLLFPHDALADDVYEEVLRPLRESAVAYSTFGQELRLWLEELNRAAGREWLSAPEDEQREALARLEGGAFFQTVHGGVRAELYLHPEVWELIGYEGSSLEYGGYIHRGFDDIDWLPEV